MKTTHLATDIFGAYKLSLHYRRPIFGGMQYIKNPEEAHTVLKSCINLEELDLRECFWVILLTNANRVLGVSEVASGTTRNVMSNPRYIFQLALLSNASSIIIAHSHPSGNTNISASDVKETRKFKKLSRLLDITLLDHIILTSESFNSFIQEGLL